MGGFERTIRFGPDVERSYGIETGDLDNDGDLDIAVANDGQSNAVYFNNDGSFERFVLAEDPVARSYDVAIGDLNGDEFADLAFANSGSMSRIHINATYETAESMISR